jgi:hypothetical protein
VRRRRAADEHVRRRWRHKIPDGIRDRIWNTIWNWI